MLSNSRGCSNLHLDFERFAIKVTRLFRNCFILNQSFDRNNLTPDHGFLCKSTVDHSMFTSGNDCSLINPQDSAVNSHCLEAVCGLTDLCCLDWGVLTGPHVTGFTDPHSNGVVSGDEPLLPIAPHLCSNLTSEFKIQKDSNGNPMLSLNELNQILCKRLTETDIRVFRVPVTSASRLYFRT